MKYFGLSKPIDQTWLLLAGLLCPMKCILASISGSAFISIVFGTIMHYWPLWLIELLFYLLGYTYIDTPQYIGEPIGEGTQNYIGAIL